MDPEVKKILDDHESRIKKLENNLLIEKKNKIKEATKGYKGLAGGIRFIIKSGFLNNPRSLNEIINELKREGYHYSKSGVASTLSETFVKSQKILNRIKEGKIWKYVLRK